MNEQGTVAVIGAGVIGATVAFALAREGRRVLLLDRAEPGVAGASFGNVGHIAAELVQPLPSPALLWGFWRELICFDGALDLPARQALRMLPWMRRFAAAAFKRAENTRHLRPLVAPAAFEWARCLAEVGRSDLLRRRGSYEVGFGERCRRALQAQRLSLQALGIRSCEVSAEQLLPLQQAARAPRVSGLWFEDSAHVADPLEVTRACVGAALARGAELRSLDVRGLQLRGAGVEILSDAPPFVVDAAVVCAGIDSPPLLAPLGAAAPLQAVRGYHIEMPGQAALLDAPVVYNDEHVLVTPLNGRLRASSYMEFSAPDAPADPRKAVRLREKVRRLGYVCAPQGPYWMGSRPVLPDYLPGIGRAGSAPVFYAIGHQHLGLTMAPITAELIADLVAQRPPRLPIEAFDLKRFGSPT